MKYFKSIISRIRWNVVLSVIAVLVVLILAFLVFRPLSAGTACSDGVCIRSSSTPSDIQMSGSAELRVEVMNRGEEDRTIEVKVDIPNPVMYFKKTKSQTVSEEIMVASGESQILSFELQGNATNPGSYRVDVTASYGKEDVVEELYVRILG